MLVKTTRRAALYVVDHAAMLICSLGAAAAGVGLLLSGTGWDWWWLLAYLLLGAYVRIRYPFVRERSLKQLQRLQRMEADELRKLSATLIAIAHAYRDPETVAELETCRCKLDRLDAAHATKDGAS